MSTGQSPKKRGNGTPPPIPAGGVDLSRVRAVMPRTKHVTEFDGCNVEIGEEIDDDRVVTGYIFTIVDPIESHRYELRFVDKEALLKFVADLHPIGEVKPEDGD